MTIPGMEAANEKMKELLAAKAADMAYEPGVVHGAELIGIRKVGMYADAEGQIPLASIEILLPIVELEDLELQLGGPICLDTTHSHGELEDV